MQSYYDLMIRRSRKEPAPTVVSFLPKYNPPTSISTSGVPKYPNNYLFIENGILYISGNAAEGSASQIGDRENWTRIEEYIDSQNTTDYEVYGYGLESGKRTKIDYNKSVTYYTVSTNAMSGYYIKYKTINSNTWYGIASFEGFGLYRLDSSATKINSKDDWTQLSGMLYNYNSSNYDEAYGIDSAGTLYRIAYNGTLTQVATNVSKCAGLFRNGSHCGCWGNVDAISGYIGTGAGCLFIREGALYYKNAYGSLDSSGTLIDNTGTWTYIYGYASSSGSSYGIRNGHVCSIKTSGYTDTGKEGVAVGHGGIYIGTDGLVYNALGKRLTTATY